MTSALALPLPRDLARKRQAARALAAAHADHFASAEQIAHLPNADHAYWEHITTQISVKHFSWLCRQDARRTCLTLAYGDFRRPSAWYAGRPMIIDWGFASYAPLYIDLVDYFSRDEAMLYWKALRLREILLSKVKFCEGLRIASAYPAFIYLYPALIGRAT